MSFSVWDQTFMLMFLIQNPTHTGHWEFEHIQKIQAVSYTLDTGSGPDVNFHHNDNHNDNVKIWNHSTFNWNWNSNCTKFKL